MLSRRAFFQRTVGGLLAAVIAPAAKPLFKSRLWTSHAAVQVPWKVQYIPMRKVMARVRVTEEVIRSHGAEGAFTKAARLHVDDLLRDMGTRGF